MLIDKHHVPRVASIYLVECINCLLGKDVIFITLQHPRAFINLYKS